MAESSRQLPGDDKNDLGFGSKVSGSTVRRFLNRDGSFNVERLNLPFWQSNSLYHSLLTMTWTRFYAAVGITYLVVNLVFASLYYFSGSTFQGISGGAHGEFWEYFFFSVQTFTTIGYGRVNPQGTAANVIAAGEALVGVLGIAVATGLLFARFSRPTANILFSRKAAVGQFRGGKGLKIRMLNLRRNQLINLSATLVLSRVVRNADGALVRKWQQLPLDRPEVMFFPLNWTIVHELTPESPLYGETAASLTAADAELLLLVTATEEHFSATVHARTSYKFSEVAFDADFADMYLPATPEGVVRIDASKLHDVRPLNGA